MQSKIIAEQFTYPQLSWTFTKLAVDKQLYQYEVDDFSDLFPDIRRHKFDLKIATMEILFNAYDAIVAAWDKALYINSPIEKGSIFVKSKEQVNARGSFLNIVVSDNGLGIFAPNSRYKQERRHTYFGGLGLGLKEYVKEPLEKIGGNYSLTLNDNPTLIGTAMNVSIICVPLRQTK